MSSYPAGKEQVRQTHDHFKTPMDARTKPSVIPQRLSGWSVSDSN